MALFGAPIAHEDHAARACYAALYLCDALEELRPRGAARARPQLLGPHGPQLGRGGGRRRSATTCTWTTRRSATPSASRRGWRRSRSRASRYLTKSTAALVDGYFALEDLGESEVKGVPRPGARVSRSPASGARARGSTYRAGRGLSRFVGRDGGARGARGGVRALARAAARSWAWWRIRASARAGCAASSPSAAVPAGIDVTEGRGVAHGRRIPLLPVVEMLRGYFGIGEDDDGRVAREKIAGRLLLLDEAFRERCRCCSTSSASPDPDHPAPQMGPEARERALFGAISRLVHARADEGGGVILVEDLHWLDPGERGVPRPPDRVAARHADPRDRQLPARVRRGLDEALLLPATAAAPARRARRSRRLVRDLIGDDSSLDGIVELIADRTGGNPFFIEEVVQSLVDARRLVGRRGAYRLAASIDAARDPADRAGGAGGAHRPARRARQGACSKTAAVIGREFSEPVLQRVTGARVARLLESLGQARAPPSWCSSVPSTRSRSTCSSTRSPRRSRIAAS